MLIVIAKESGLNKMEEAEEEENYQKPICTFYCTSTTMKKRISGIVVVV